MMYRSTHVNVIPLMATRKAQQMPVSIFTKLINVRGPGSVVGTATGYGLDGPGIESQLGQDFLHLSIPALGPTQPPVQWVMGLCRGVKSGRSVTMTPHPLLVPQS